MDDEPRPSRTHLAGVEEDRPRGGVGSGIEVRRILQDDVGRLATELEVDPFDIAVGGVAQKCRPTPSNP
jgi:hypothetical protein